MDQLTRAYVPPTRIELAREADFTLGALEIRPSRREVEAAGARHVLQRRVMQVLVALAHSTTEVVPQQELILRCWDGLAVSDDAIGRCIAQLRRLASSWAEPPFEIVTIAGVGYRLAATNFANGAGAPPPPGRLRSWRRRGSVVAIAAAAAALLLGLWLAGPRPPRPIGPPVVAVLGFQPADGSPAAKAFAEVLTTRVADALSRYDATVVSAPAGLVAGRRPGRNGAGADFVVGGRVAGGAGKSIVTTDLTDPRDNILVYSFDTPEPAGADGDVADEIATHIALSLDPSKFTNDLGGKLTAADYTLVARANAGIDRWDTPYVFDQTRQLAQRHPNDGELRASVAISAIYAAQQVPASQKQAFLDIGRQSLKQAEQLDPNSGLLYVGKGLLVNGPMSYAEQERLTRKSLQLNPGLHVSFNGLGDTLLTVGRTGEGAALILRSVQLDPMSGVVVGDAFLDMVKTGDKPEAQRLLEAQQRTRPDGVLGWKYFIAFYLGSPDDIIALARRSPVSTESYGKDGAHAALIIRAWKTRDPAEIRQMARNCLDDYGKSDIEDRDCFYQLVRLGALDDAFRFAAIAYPDNRALYPIDSDDWIRRPPRSLDPMWLFAPAMRPFRDDARFWDVAVRQGLVNYWQSTGSWPDFCLPQLDRCKRLAAAAALSRPLPAAGRRAM